MRWVGSVRLGGGLAELQLLALDGHLGGQGLGGDRQAALHLALRHLLLDDLESGEGKRGRERRRGREGRVLGNAVLDGTRGRVGGARERGRDR